MKLLDQKGLSLERLGGFLEVADAGSIAMVARGDPSRQALLSRQIKELEDFFTVKLTRRSGRGLELTDAGRDLARRSRDAFRLWEDFREGNAGRKRRLVIGASGSVLEWLLIPRAGRTLSASYELRFLSEQTLTLVRKLEDGEINLAVLRENALSPHLTAVGIGSFGYELWAAKTLLSRTTMPDMTSVPLALPLGGSFREKLEEVASRAGVTLKVAVETNAFSQAVEAMRTGSYAAILPDYVGRSLDARRFHTIAWKPLKRITRTLCVAHRKQRHDLSKARDSLVEKLTLSR